MPNCLLFKVQVYFFPSKWINTEKTGGEKKNSMSPQRRDKALFNYLTQ